MYLSNIFIFIECGESISCQGDINGDANADGNISCKGTINGNINSGSGVVCCDNIAGDITCGGNVECKNIYDNVMCNGEFYTNNSL